MGRSGIGSDSATTLVNFPIDSLLLRGTLDSRPMLAWIFNDDTYLDQYHQVFDDFITNYFENLIHSTIPFSYILFGSSVLILATGINFAAKYKR